MDGLSGAQQDALHSVAQAGRTKLDSLEMEQLAALQKKRTNVAKEIVSTEQTYVQVLNNIVNAFLTPLKAGNLIQDGIVTVEERRQMFPNALQILLQCHSQFLKLLEARLASWSADTCFGDLFLDMINYFKLYPVYVSNFEQQLRCIRELKKRQPRFAEFIKGGFVILQDSNSTLSTLLITPVQRIPRYLMLVKDFRKKTPENHPDYPDLTSALEKLGDIANYVDQKAQDAENVQKMLQVQEQIQGKYPTIMAPQRRFVFQGFVNDVRGKDLHPRGLFLFNDIVVWAKVNDAKKRGRAKKHAAAVSPRGKKSQPEYTYGSRVSIEGAEVVDMEDVSKSIRFCFGLKLAGRVHLISVDEQKKKARWLQHFAECIKDFSEKAAEQDKLKSMAELRKFQHHQRLAAESTASKSTEPKPAAKKERKGWRFLRKTTKENKSESLTLPVTRDPVDAIDANEMPSGFRSARAMSTSSSPKGPRAPKVSPRSLRGSPNVSESKTGSLVIKKTVQSRAITPAMKKAHRSSRRIIEALPEGQVDDEQMEVLRSAFESFDHMDDKTLNIESDEGSTAGSNSSGHRRSLSSPAGITMSPKMARASDDDSSSSLSAAAGDAAADGRKAHGGEPLSKVHPKMRKFNKQYRSSAYDLPKNAHLAAATPEELALDEKVELALRKQKLQAALARESMATPPRPRRRPPKLAEANTFRKSRSAGAVGGTSGSKRCISCTREMPELSAVCNHCDAAQQGSGFIIGEDGEAVAVEMIYVDEEGNPVTPPRESESVSFEEMVEVIEDDGSYEYVYEDDNAAAAQTKLAAAAGQPKPPWTDDDEEASESRSSDVG